MPSAETITKMKIRLNISDAEPRFGSTKLAAAINHGALALAVLSGLLLIAARPAQAQTEEVLYGFCSQPSCGDGGNPFANLTSNGGDLYGTTVYGGESGYGTVFELSPNGGGGWNESVLYSFCSALNSGRGVSLLQRDIRQPRKPLWNDVLRRREWRRYRVRA